jgi:hypothetical protein
MSLRSLSLGRLVRPYWGPLAIAFLAMLAQSATDLMEPWPLKVVFDYVSGSKAAPRWLRPFLPSMVAVTPSGLTQAGDCACSGAVTNTIAAT